MHSCVGGWVVVVMMMMMMMMMIMMVCFLLGVKGPKEFLNGTYDPIGILNGKPLYRKRGDDSRWLRYTLKGTHWMISDTANKGQCVSE